MGCKCITEFTVGKNRGRKKKFPWGLIIFCKGIQPGCNWVRLSIDWRGPRREIPPTGAHPVLKTRCIYLTTAIEIPMKPASSLTQSHLWCWEVIPFQSVLQAFRSWNCLSTEMERVVLPCHLCAPSSLSGISVCCNKALIYNMSSSTKQLWTAGLFWKPMVSPLLTACRHPRWQCTAPLYSLKAKPLQANCVCHSDALPYPRDGVLPG